MKKNKIFLMFAFIALMANSHMEGENIKPLSDVNVGSDADMQVIRDGASDYCEGEEDDDREECVMDFYANHNLDEEPSCD